MDVLGLNLSNPSIQQKASHAHPYASSIASSASSSSSSIFSLDCVSSQSSISSSSTNPVDVIWENEASGESQVTGRGLVHSNESSSRCLRGGVRGSAPKVADAAVPPELRKHPRRTSCNNVAQPNGASSACPRPPPSLVRQCERKVNFVDNLVGKSHSNVGFSCSLAKILQRYGIADSGGDLAALSDGTPERLSRM